MGFENLLTSLEEKGKLEENAILSAAKAEARKTNASASEKAKQIMDEAKSDGQKLGVEQRLEINANARLRQRKVIAKARETALNAAIQEIEPLLREFTQGKQYDKLLLQLAHECTKALGKDAVLQCRKADEKTLKATAGFNNIKGTINIIGGGIAESPDGRIRVDNSLETLLENHKEKLKQTAFKELASTFKQLQPKPTEMPAAVKAVNTGQTSKSATAVKEVQLKNAAKLKAAANGKKKKIR